MAFEVESISSPSSDVSSIFKPFLEVTLDIATYCNALFYILLILVDFNMIGVFYMKNVDLCEYWCVVI